MARKYGSLDIEEENFEQNSRPLEEVIGKFDATSTKTAIMKIITFLPVPEFEDDSEAEKTHLYQTGRY